MRNTVLHTLLASLLLPLLSACNQVGDGSTSTNNGAVNNSDSTSSNNNSTISLQPSVPAWDSGLSRESVLQNGSSTIALSWQISKGITGNYWELMQNDQLVFSESLSFSGDSQRVSKSVSVSVAGDYRFIARVCNKLGDKTECSETAAFTHTVSAEVVSDMTTPPSVAQLSPISTSYTLNNQTVAIPLMWTASGSPANSWQLYANDFMVHEANLTNSHDQVGAFTFNATQAGDFQFYVRLCNSKGCSKSANVSTQVKAAALVPAKAVLDAILPDYTLQAGQAAVTLSWHKSSGNNAEQWSLLVNDVAVFEAKLTASAQAAQYQYNATKIGNLNFQVRLCNSSSCSVSNSVSTVIKEVVKDEFADTDLILSVSQPSLCLAQLNSATLNSVIGVRTCDPNDGAQRFGKSTSVLQTADKKLCVTAKALSNLAELSLQNCDGSVLQSWTYSSNVYSNASYALDLTSERKVIVYSKHGNSNQQWRRYSDMLAEVNNNKSVLVTYPIAVSDSVKLKLENARDAVNRLTAVKSSLPTVRDVSKYPGDVDSKAARISQTFQWDRRVKKFTHYGWSPEWYHTLHTGLWAPAGAAITLTVGNGDVANTYVRVNAQDDVLNTDGSDINGSDQLKRFANVTTRVPLKNGVMQIRSQYGGFIQLESTQYADSTLSVTISDAVAAAYFNTATHSLSDWSTIKQIATPWITIEGKRAVITVPRDQVAALNDPISLMKYYDEHVQNIEWLAGFDGSDARNPKLELKQHLLYDPQIIAGYGHAGYPIMVSFDWSLAKLTDAKSMWGNVHEIGHNYQPFNLWASRYGTESNVNLFSLYALEKQGEASRLVKDGRFKDAVKKINDGVLKSFENDADVWDRCVFFMQLKYAFPQKGWNLFRELYRAYRALPDSELKLITANAQMQWDKNYELMSQVSGYDLTEHYQHWGVPISAAAIARVQAKKLPKPTMQTWLISPTA